MMTSWPRRMKSGFMVLSQIDQACRDNWLKIYYQPLIDIQNMKLAECEALSHWIVLREIEITESALNDSSQAMVEAVQHFHDLGLPGLDG